MLDILLIVVTGLIGGGQGTSAPSAEAAAPAAPVASAPAQDAPMAEPQVPTGRFTTATEVRPILDMTRGNWVAVRDFDGQDLLYVTHLLAWRCGLVGLRYSVNDGPLQDWALPPCHEDTASPNALLPDDGAPYVRLPAGSVAQVEIELTFDDLSVAREVFERAAILMP